MNSDLVTRFCDVYHKLYGIIPELILLESFYRSPHLPMAMSPRRFLAHIIRLESRLPPE